MSVFYISQVPIAYRLAERNICRLPKVHSKLLRRRWRTCGRNR